jgi:hypothetical protein
VCVRWTSCISLQQIFMSHYPFVALRLLPFIFTSFPKSLVCVLFVYARVRGARLRRNAETSLFACVKEQRLLAGKSQGALFGPAPHLHKSKQHEYLMRRPANFFSTAVKCKCGCFQRYLIISSPLSLTREKFLWCRERERRHFCVINI